MAISKMPLTLINCNAITNRFIRGWIWLRVGASLWVRFGLRVWLGGSGLGLKSLGQFVLGQDDGNRTICLVKIFFT